MTRLYKSLKSAVSSPRKNQTEEMAFLHCTQAIQAINDTVKNSLSVGGKIEKRIYVLDGPPI